MNKKKIIITGIGGDIAQALAKTLGREEFFLIGCDMSRVPYASFFVDQFYLLPAANDSQAFLKVIKEIILTQKVDFILPVPEPELRVLNKYRSLLKAWPCQLMMQSELVLDLFLDKLKTADFLQEQGIPSPKTVEFKNFRNDLTFPFIVKGRFGCGSRNIWVIKDTIDLDYLRHRDDGSLIAQEYLGQPKEEYTTGVFSDGKKTVSISFQRKLGFGGLSKEITLVQEPALDALALDISDAVQLQGSINIQSRFHKGAFVPFEINPRISSSVLFRKKFGFEDVLWWIAHLNGESFQYRPAFLSGRGFRVLTELFVDLKSNESNR
jgi:carbamoyl-phosphate synthase large subunit